MVASPRGAMDSGQRLLLLNWSIFIFHVLVSPFDLNQVGEVSSNDMHTRHTKHKRHNYNYTEKFETSSIGNDSGNAADLE